MYRSSICLAAMSLDNSSYDDEHEAFAARYVLRLCVAPLLLVVRRNAPTHTLTHACSRSSDYVFVATPASAFDILDRHADTIENDVKLPQVVLGDEGMSLCVPTSALHTCVG
jgi:hypothetical protein